jgi:hypothetical protein
MENNATQCTACKKAFTFDSNGKCHGCQLKEEDEAVKAHM